MTTNDYIVLSYVRVSTEEQTHTKSCDDQMTLIHRHIEQQGWKLAKNGDYRDEGISGTKLERPGLQEMLVRCQEDKAIKAIVVTETDRLARGLDAYIPIRAILKKHQVKLIAITQQMVDDSAEGRMIGEILGAVNGLQVEVTRRKSMRALDEKAKRGWYPSKAPLGYVNVNIGTEERPDRIIDIDPVKAPHVKQIPGLYNQGLSYQEVADRLHAQGLEGNQDGKVSAEEIRKILFNDFYLGEFYWRGVKYQGKHEPLFKWFEVMQARNRSQEKSQTRGSIKDRDRHIFKRLPFFCPDCQCRITAETKTKHYPRTHRIAEYTFYHCTKSKGGWKACTQPSINGSDLISEFATKAVAPIDIDLELAQFLFEEMTKEHSYQREQNEKIFNSINIKLGQVDAALQGLFQSLIRKQIPSYQGRTPQQIYDEERLKLEVEQKKLLQTKKKLDEGSEEWKQKSSNFLSDCINATNLFLEAKDDKRFRFLNRVTSNVFLNEKKLLVSHKFPFSEMAKYRGHEQMLRAYDYVRTIQSDNLAQYYFPKLQSVTL